MTASSAALLKMVFDSSNPYIIDKFLH